MDTITSDKLIEIIFLFVQYFIYIFAWDATSFLNSDYSRANISFYNIIYY